MTHGISNQAFDAATLQLHDDRSRYGWEFSGTVVPCPKCGSKHLKIEHVTTFDATDAVNVVMRCLSCGAWPLHLGIYQSRDYIENGGQPIVLIDS